MKTIFHNATIITPATSIEKGVVEVEGKKIVAVYQGTFENRDAVLVNCRGNFLTSGFIDGHIHGAGGFDFMDATPEAAKNISRISANHGTTALLATTLSASRERILNALDNITIVSSGEYEGARIIGVHLEGNYFSMEQKGAQNPAHIYPPPAQEYEEFLGHANIRVATAAPEVEGCLEFARNLSSKGITVSMGHTVADYDAVVKGIEAGFSHATHAYNGMSYYSNTNYYPAMGTCESVLLRDEITIEVIADGKHVSPPMLQLMYKIKGADRMQAVTDAVMACMPDGEYKLGGLDTIVTDGVCMLKDRTSFAGSIATTDRLLRTLYQLAGIPLGDAVKMLTTTPARVIGIERQKGRVAVGFDADINVFDDGINVICTMIEGKFHKNNL